MNNLKSRSKFLTIFQTIIILCIGVVLSWYFGLSVFNNEKKALVNRVYNVAKMLDPEIVDSLNADSTDLDNGSYLYLKRKLVDLKSINTDAKFLYVMGYNRDVNKLFFFADSESEDSISTYSPPGQIYDDTTEDAIDNFLKGVAYAEGPYSDNWGRWISAYAPVLSAETGLPIAIVGIDVSASKLVQDIAFAASFPFILSIALAILFMFSNKIRNKEKNAELDNVKMEFTSFMSHEIRGFITKMKGGLRALLHEDFGALGPDQSKFVQDMMFQSDDFGELIEEFLDIGHLEQDTEIALSKGSFNLLDIIKGAVADAQEQLNKKTIGILYEGNVPDKIFCNCDNNKVGRVFSNIILNAIKYSPEKSSIHVGYIDSNTEHTLYIKDSGIGIPEKESGKMFNKFFRASNAREIHFSGTGLGLYFSKLIVEKHKGRIWYESREGSGTTFYVSLPKE
jgi:signal transduction histidine kinase